MNKESESELSADETEEEAKPNKGKKVASKAAVRTLQLGRRGSESADRAG